MPTTTPLKRDFIGLDVMGAPMCVHLIAAGRQPFVNTRGKVPAAIAQTTATQCTTLRGVAERADIILVMASDTPDVEKVLFGEGGVAQGRKGSSGKAVVDMSSISPVATREFTRRIEAAGTRYLDAHVSGGEVGARNATLSIMVGVPRTCSRASGRCWRRWAEASRGWAATATARPPRWPTSSSSR